MSLEFNFTCPLLNGVHARPASVLEEVARGFGAEIVLTNKRTGRTANAKSVLGIIGAEIRHNDECHVTFMGTDAREAMAALSTFLREKFPHCDDLFSSVTVPNGEVPLPPGLRNTGSTVYHGTPAVPGVGCGRIVQTRGLRTPESIPTRGFAEHATEIRKLDVALAALVGNYEERLRQPGSRLELELLHAHLSVARDPEFQFRLQEAIRKSNGTVAGAIMDTEARFTAMLRGSESQRLRERTPDIRDVCFQLMCQVYGTQAMVSDRPLTSNSIVVADLLTPEQFLALDRRFLKGLVLGHTGPMSHTVILARSFGIPTLTGAAGIAGRQLEGEEAMVDGGVGVLVTDLTEPVRRYCVMEERRLAERRARQRRFASQPGVTPDGQRLEIAANVGAAAEAVQAFDAGADSIGLFRTEMLFLDRPVPPTEEEQFEEYRQTLAAAGARPVIIRTLDIGGDKPLAFLKQLPEHNPFLGSRAVRIYPEFESLFRTQVRAIVRASAHGRLQLMIPMVSSLEEVSWTRQIIAEEQARCKAEAIPFDRNMKVGAMIEVPAAAFLLDALGRELDFFSIGSNDLLQGFAAVDRTNPRLARLYDPLQPAFIRLLKKIVDDAHAGGKWVGLCGEIGGQTDYLPLLVGLGLDEISAAPSALIGLKAELAIWPAQTCRELVGQALTCATADEVRTLLKEYAGKHPVPLLDPEMVLLSSDSTTKEEAIKELVDRLYVVGRTEQPRAVEQAVWQREMLYSTGIGDGLAIPHCKTNAVTANSLAVLKLRTPVNWDSVDGKPVHTVILLTVRESDAAGKHMKIISQLARKFVHAEFHQRLGSLKEESAVCEFLKENLGD